MFALEFQSGMISFTEINGRKRTIDSGQPIISLNLPDEFVQLHVKDRVFLELSKNQSLLNPLNAQLLTVLLKKAGLNQGMFQRCSISSASWRPVLAESLGLCSFISSCFS